MADIPILQPEKDDVAVSRQNTTLENKRYLSVKDGGVYLPIAWDEIVGVTCEGGAKTRKYILNLDGALGEDMPVMECDYYKYEYIAVDNEEEVVEALPPEQGGDGNLFYSKKVSNKVLINDEAGGSLGQHNTIRLLKGLDYVRSDNVLTGDKALDKIKK